MSAWSYGSGGRTAQLSSEDAGIADAVIRSSETQKLIVSPGRNSVIFVSLPFIRIVAFGPGRKLKVVRSLPSLLCSVTVVLSALFRYTLALNFA